MDEKELKKFKELLLKKKTELQKSLESLNEDSKPVDLSTPIGRLSRMDAIQEQQLKLENKRQMELTLIKIESALLKDCSRAGRS